MEKSKKKKNERQMKKKRVENKRRKNKKEKKEKHNKNKGQIDFKKIFYFSFVHFFLLPIGVETPRDMNQ